MDAIAPGVPLLARPLVLLGQLVDLHTRFANHRTLSVPSSLHGA